MSRAGIVIPKLDPMVLASQTLGCSSPLNSISMVAMFESNITPVDTTLLSFGIRVRRLMHRDRTRSLGSCPACWFSRRLPAQFLEMQISLCQLLNAPVALTTQAASIVGCDRSIRSVCKYCCCAWLLEVGPFTELGHPGEKSILLANKR
jgi:hypothetical protein